MTKKKVASRRRSLREIFLVPTVLGVVSAVGLVGALIGDNLYDWIGWIGLGLPVAVMSWFILRPAHHL